MENMYVLTDGTNYFGSRLMRTDEIEAAQQMAAIHNLYYQREDIFAESSFNAQHPELNP